MGTQRPRASLSPARILPVSCAVVSEMESQLPESPFWCVAACCQRWSASPFCLVRSRRLGVFDYSDDSPSQRPSSRGANHLHESQPQSDANPRSRSKYQSECQPMPRQRSGSFCRRRQQFSTASLTFSLNRRTFPSRVPFGRSSASRVFSGRCVCRQKPKLSVSKIPVIESSKPIRLTMPVVSLGDVSRIRVTSASTNEKLDSLFQSQALVSPVNPHAFFLLLSITFPRITSSHLNGLVLR